MEKPQRRVGAGRAASEQAQGFNGSRHVGPRAEVCGVEAPAPVFSLGSVVFPSILQSDVKITLNGFFDNVFVAFAAEDSIG